MKELCCGFADGIITPVLNGTFLDGYGFRTTPADSIRDELHAKVMAVGDGKTTVLVFSIDLIGMTPPLYRLLTRQITAITGVRAENCALNFIHTHSAPTVGSVAELPINYDYLAHVGDVCGELALKAMARRVPCTVRTEILPERLIHVCNRRGRDVLDPAIRAAAFRDLSGKLLGVLCSAGCHAVINTRMCVSADWLSVLNRASSDEAPLLFLQGKGGDVNPAGIPGVPDTMAEDPDGLIEMLGSELAGPVLRFAAKEAPGEILCGEIGMRYERLRVPMKEAGDIAALRNSVREAELDYFAEAPENRHMLFRELQWRRWMLDRAEAGETNDLTVPMQVLLLGDRMAFAFVPFELLTITGQKIERVFADAGWAPERTWVLGYSNSVNGYLAPKEEFPYGGYEVAGASHWYNVPDTTEESAETVVEWFGRQRLRL